MKKNDMLNESTIRRFMKLATIDSLSDKFVDEKLQESEEQELEERGMMKPKRDDDKMREGEHDDDDKMREGAHEDDEDVKEGKHKDDDEMRESEEELTFEEEDLEERGMDMPMDRDDDMEAAPAAGGMVSVDDLMSALERALEDVLGQEVEVSQDGEEEMDMDADADADMDMDMDMDADDAEAEMDAGEEEELEEVNDDVIEEVFARVIQRLTQEAKSNK